MFLRFPGLLGAVAVGTLLLTLTAGASTLYLSAVAGEVLRERIASPAATRYGAGMSYRGTNVGLTQRARGRGGPLFEERGKVFAARAAKNPLLGPTVSTVSGPEVAISVGGDTESRRGRLVARTDVLDHITVVDGREGSGVWVADVVADALGISPGDTITLDNEGHTVEIEVDGIYRALYVEPRSARSGYWLAWVDQIYKRDPTCDGCPIPATFVIGDRKQVLDLTERLGERAATFGWDAPVSESRDLSVDDGRNLASFIDDFRGEISNSRSDLGRLFDCCGRRFSRGVRLHIFTTTFSSSISQVVSQTDDRIAAIEGPVRLLLVAGLLTAASVLAAGGAFAMARRRAETTFLYVRGMSAVGVGVRGAIESTIPCIVGALAGLLLASWLVEVFGPDGAISDSARRTAALAAFAAVPASIVLVGIVCALWFQRNRSEVPAGGSGWQVPVEIVLIAAAFFVLRRLQTGGAFIDGDAGSATRPSLSLLLFPILFTAGFGALAARIFTVFLRLARARSAQWPTPLYLALHRLASAPRLTILLVTASTLCLGIFINARAVVQSLETTIEAKAKLFVGSDVQANVNPNFPDPEGFPLPVTMVTRLQRAGTFEPGGATFDLLAVDPDTLAAAAYWDDGFASVSLEQIAARLASSGRGRVPVLVATDGELPRRAGLSIAGRVIPVDVFATANAFPGMISLRPFVVMNADVFTSVYGLSNPLGVANATTELWVQGDARKAIAELTALDPAPYLFLTVAEVKDVPSITAVVNTFGVLNVLAGAAALLVLVILLMHVQTRQREQIVAYGLSRRMGLRHAGYRRSLVVEITVILVLSCVLGFALAVISAQLISSRLDPLATIPPDPLFEVPWTLIPITLGASLLVSWWGGLITSQRARNAELGQAVRVSE